MALLGLDFEQFAAVVLPQGEFAEFLHDKPGRGRTCSPTSSTSATTGAWARRPASGAAAARTRAEFLEERLAGDLAGATAAARDQAVAVVDAIDALAEKVGAALPQVDDLVERARRAATAADGANEHVRLLAAVRQPDDVSGLATGLADARAAADVAGAAADAAEGETLTLVQAREALGDRRSADAAVAAYRRREQLLERRVVVDATKAAAAETMTAGADAADEAEGVRSIAEEALEAARTRLSGPRPPPAPHGRRHLPRV